MPFTNIWQVASAITRSIPLLKFIPSLETLICVYLTATVFGGGEIAGTWTPIILSLITEIEAFTVVAERLLLADGIGTPYFIKITFILNNFKL